MAFFFGLKPFFSMLFHFVDIGSFVLSNSTKVYNTKLRYECWTEAPTHEIEKKKAME